MVFNRKQEPMRHNFSAPEMRAADRSRFSAPQPAQPSADSESQMVESVIGNDLSIEGQTITIRCKGSLTVNGNIQADLHSRRLQVGKEAVVNGAIAADAVDVYGRVQGAIHGEKVMLRAGAEVEGDIMSSLLSVEEGANFDGRSRRVRDPADIQPQLESVEGASGPVPRAGHETTVSGQQPILN